jgi:hypothetical protein
MYSRSEAVDFSQKKLGASFIAGLRPLETKKSFNHRRAGRAIHILNY